MVPQNIADRLLNKTSILNNFKSFIKQVYQKQQRVTINKKNDQNNYFRAGIAQEDEQLLRLKAKRKIDC